MAKEGSVAPKERVNVTFTPDGNDASEEVELPLKLMVLGDFTQREDDRTIEERKPIAIATKTDGVARCAGRPKGPAGQRAGFP